MANPSDLYNEEYYRSHLGLPYSRESSHFMSFFSGIADQLVRTLSPRTVMDAGCAMGLLVEMLWDRGVEAWGIDISPYAISQVRPDIRSYCRVASLAEPISGRYDLIVCIEVLEHMPEAEAVQAIENLARASDTILFSSSPNDFAEPTHVNVHQPMWWLAQFQRVGFAPDLLFDCTFLTQQAMLLRKTDEPLAYEVQRLFSDLPRTRNRAVAAEECVRQLTEQVSQSTATIEQLNKQLSNQTEQLAAYQKPVQDVAGSREEYQRMRDDLADANDAIRSLTARQEALTSQFGGISSEISGMHSLVVRCEQRSTIFLQQIEHSEGALQELQQSVAEQSARWEHHVSSQRAVFSNIENRCLRLAASVQSMEPRVAGAESRIEELTRLHLNIHQRVNGLAAQVQEILHSRIWKALVNAGGLLLKVTGRRR